MLTEVNGLCTVSTAVSLEEVLKSGSVKSCHFVLPVSFLSDGSIFFVFFL